MTLPTGILRDIFAKDGPERLLRLLAASPRPLLYTHARDALHQHPQEFARALGALEKWGLVQLQVVPRKERPDARRRVAIQLTALGHTVVRFHSAVDREWEAIAHQAGLATDTLASL